MMAAKYKPFEYGKSPNPRNWQEAADVLKQGSKPKRKSSGFHERLVEIERMLKEQKKSS